MTTGFEALRGEIEKVRGSVRLAVAASTIGQLLTAGSVLGIVAKALKWF